MNTPKFTLTKTLMILIYIIWLVICLYALDTLVTISKDVKDIKILVATYNEYYFRNEVERLSKDVDKTEFTKEYKY